MAEYVKRRMTAAKLGIGFACAALVGGIVEKVRPESARVDASPAAAHLSRQSGLITSSQIKNHSLLYKDFRQHQVASYAEFKDVLVRLDGVDGESQDAKHKDTIELESIHKIDSTLSTLKASVSHLTAKVSNDVVQGQGSVFSGTQDVGNQGQAKDLLTVTGSIKVQGLYTNIDSPAIRIVNQSSNSFDVIWNDGQHEHDDVLAAGQGQHLDLTFATGDDLITAQLLSGDGQAITLTLSRVVDQGQKSSRFVAQALAGS
jgi:hypothetical protein